jgi:hypothetical protein
MPPHPGSKEAVELGCICSVLDNNYGMGFGKPVRYLITENCPIHSFYLDIIPLIKPKKKS